ncbi:unnamed protein product, partial [Larinioides sclopetarius]
MRRIHQRFSNHQVVAHCYERIPGSLNQVECS